MVLVGVGLGVAAGVYLLFFSEEEKSAPPAASKVRAGVTL